MKKPDTIASVNKERWERVVEEGAGSTRPYLDLDVEAFRAYREGETTVLPEPCCDSADDRLTDSPVHQSRRRERS
jgi:hypothetical protein